MDYDGGLPGGGWGGCLSAGSGMRIERASGWPVLPRWALLVLVAYSVLVGVVVYLERSAGRGEQHVHLCLFRQVAGRPCPGCGITRMVLAGAGGRLGEALRWNPLGFGLCVGGLALLVLRVGFGRRVVWITSARSRRLLTIALLLAVLANWVYLLNVM